MLCARSVSLVVALVHFNSGHLRLRRHRHEEVLVCEAAMSPLAPHGVLGFDAHPPVVAGSVQFLAIVSRVVRVGDCAEGVVVQHGAIVVFAGDLGHQLIQEAVVISAVHPLVGVERVEREASSPRPFMFLQSLLVCHPGHQVIDDPEAVQRHVMLEWMAEDAVVPLGNLRQGTINHIHDGRR